MISTSLCGAHLNLARATIKKRGRYLSKYAVDAVTLYNIYVNTVESKDEVDIDLGDVFVLFNQELEKHEQEQDRGECDAGDRVCCTEAARRVEGHSQFRTQDV